jgi:hypothetical protein
VNSEQRARVKADLETALSEGLAMSVGGAKIGEQVPQVQATDQKEHDPYVVANMVLGAAQTGTLLANAFHSLGEWGKGKLTPVGLLDHLKDAIESVNSGDLKEVEAMLVAQAASLQTLFANLALRAAATTDVRRQGELLTLALKAQNNCRATIAALTDIKFPRQVSFNKQTNVAHGPQQVNNGVPAPGGAAGEPGKPAALPSPGRAPSSRARARKPRR